MNKGVGRSDERIDEGVRWFDHVEKTENNRIATRVYVDERWIDSVKECLRERGKQGEGCMMIMYGGGL